MRDTPSATATGTDSFPRLSARTLRFTLGAPRDISVTADGATVLFVRTASGTDRHGALWGYDVRSGTERLLADPAALLDGTDEDLPDAERRRRERLREAGSGIVSYTVSRDGRTAAFALSAAVWVCDIATGRCTRLPTTGAAVDPRIDPTGRFVAYASGRSLRMTCVDGSGDRVVAEPGPGEADTVVWGQAEFVAAEEMDRHRGFWWAPDGASMLVERYDDAKVSPWYLADPSRPDHPPAVHRYPAAGTDNADVQLWHVTIDGTRREIRWDREAFPYLATVTWNDAGAAIEVLARDQRRGEIIRVDADAKGVATEVLLRLDEPAWVELIEGLPALSPDGRLVSPVCDEDDGSSTRRLAVDGVPVSPPGLQLRQVLAVGAADVVAAVSADPVDTHLVRLGYDGRVEYLSSGPGVYTGAAGGDTVVVAGCGLDDPMVAVTVSSGGVEAGRVRSLAEDPGFVPRVTLLTVGERDLRTAVILPQGHRAGSRRLPIVMAPYGGPHGQLVRSSARAYLQSQWLADQGFAVVVADGRGTPGRGPAWERAIAGDFASVTLADQIDALSGAVAAFPDDLDTGRVGITGWSFGGYLAALAVLERPDVFHAAVAGAPVTDWTLYDTCYTERYLGMPGDHPEVYRHNSLLGRADRLDRPLLLIHGVADDNVVFAHTLRLSAALLAAGRPHQVLPLTGVTHMASAEVVAENLLLTQVTFLRQALGPAAANR